MRKRTRTVANVDIRRAARLSSVRLGKSGRWSAHHRPATFADVHESELNQPQLSRKLRLRPPAPSRIRQRERGVSPCQQLVAAARRIGMARRCGVRVRSVGCWPRWPGWARIVVFVAVVAVASVVPVSLFVSMVRRVSTRTVDCCLEHERQSFEFPWPSSRRTLVLSGVRKE